MPIDLRALYEQSFREWIVHFLKHTAAKNPGLPLNDEQYDRTIVWAAWQQAPIQIRLVGRKRSQWNKLFETIRRELLVHQDGKLRVVADAEVRVGRLLDSMFGCLVDRTERTTGTNSADDAATKEKDPLPTIAGESGGSDVAFASDAYEFSAAVLNTPIASAAVSATPAAVSDTTATIVPVGIDLGTSNTVIAYVDSQGRPTTVNNGNGDLLTPSVVLFDDGGTVVGKEAVQASAMEADKVAQCVKRDMGCKSYRHTIQGEHMPPEVISSFILRRVKSDAERRIGPIRCAVITVPAYFDEPRRRATVDAGRLAGLEVLDILNEPTAAAIAYGHQKGLLNEQCGWSAERPQRILVFDLGGGTFDVTIMEILGNSFRAIATDGDVYLGGRDWDEKLVNFAAERFLKTHREDPRTNPESAQELFAAAEVAKKTLSERPKASLYVHHLGMRMKVEVTREQFEEITLPLLGRTQATTEIVVRQSGLDWTKIDKVVLVGGATRMPMVARMLEDIADKVPDASLSADEAVAHGAALYAELLLQRRAGSNAPARFQVTNVNSHSLGIVAVNVKTQRKVNQIIIPKNSSLPATATRRFRTLKPNQRNIRISILEGESELPAACTPVGTCLLRDLPSELPAGWPIEVRYTYQENGRLQVTGKLVGHDATVTTAFERESSLSESQIEMWRQCLDAQGETS